MSHKILAIDDHPDTIQLIELALQRHGYEVIGAFSGPEGLELAESERPDLILLDMMMPGMDGNAVCRALRQNPELAATPIIMFTAKSQATDKKDSFDAGADDYLTKPTRPGELLQRIQSLLARPRDTQSGAGEPPQLQTFEAAGPRFMSVLGARGGAGATTVALNIATTMADAGTDVILVDLDARQGHAAIYLGHNAGPDAFDWLNEPNGSPDETLFNHLVEIQERLLLLPSRPRAGGDHVRFRAPQMAALSTSLVGAGRTVVVDLGLNIGADMRPLLQQSDTVLICLRPERAAILGARYMLEELQNVIDTQKIQLLMLDYGTGETMPRPAVESYLKKPLCDVLKLDLREITRAVSSHQPLIHSAADGQAPHQFQRLLHQLVPAG